VAFWPAPLCPILVHFGILKKRINFGKLFLFGFFLVAFVQLQSMLAPLPQAKLSVLQCFLFGLDGRMVIL
jgi:hypothetical protein